MFAQIKAVVDIAISGLKGLAEFKSKRDRDAAVVEMLRFHFLLKGCVDEGEALIVSAGSNPLTKLKSLPAEKAKELVRSWDAGLRRQAARLYELQALLYGQAQMAIINPELEEALSKAIGYKMDRAITLHGIGSALVIRSMFSLNETDAQMAGLITYMAGERSKTKVDLERIRHEVKDLRKALVEFRSYIQRLVSDEELVRLGKKAQRPDKKTK